MTPKKRDIVTYPDPRLKVASDPISNLAELDDFLDDLIYTMFYHGGVGIAAPQIGINKQVFVLDPNHIDGSQDPIVFVNPQILSVSKDTVVRKEGCLSFPGVGLDIRRSRGVEVRATNRAGEEFQVSSEDDVLAQAIQHEYDHLTGKLMVDFLNAKDRKRFNRMSNLWG